MELIGWGLNLCGIVVSVIGTYLIYKGTPLDSTGHTTMIESHATQEQYQKDLDKKEKRGKFSKRGLGILMAGFVLQFIAQFFNIPA